MSKVNEKTINAAARLVVILDSAESVTHALFILVSSSEHEMLSMDECEPLDNLVIGNFGSRKVLKLKLQDFIRENTGK